MKQVTVNGETHEAERIVKTEDAIIGYLGSAEVFAFRGVKDFGKFQLSDGQDFDADPMQELRDAQLDLWDLVLFGGDES